MSVTYTNFGGQVVHENRGSTETFYTSDPLGSIIEGRSLSGTQTFSFNYWPYGEIRTSSGTNPSQFDFSILLPRLRLRELGGANVELRTKEGQRVRGRRMIGAIIITILVGVGFLLWLPVIGGNMEARQTAMKYIALSVSQDYEGAASQLNASPQLVKEMRKLSEEYGPIEAGEVREVYVQILGTPWGVDLITIRKGKRFLERIGGNRRRITGVFEPAPQ